jgi:hypothetical protein
VNLNIANLLTYGHIYLSPLNMPGRIKGSRNKQTLEREKSERIAAARAELAQKAPAIDFAASFDSLDIMEKVMRHFYLRALIEERMGNQTDWNAVDSLMLKALGAAEKVARYRHAQLSAVKIAGELKSGPADGATLDELLERIKHQLTKLGPILELEVACEPQARTRGG